MTRRLLHLSDAAGAAVLLRATPDKEPKWNRLFPLGMVGHRSDFKPSGRIEFTRDVLASMVRNWERAGKPARQVNYLHRGQTFGDSLPVEQKVAAGWIESLELRADGLWGLINWTERARGFIERDEFRYLSPEFHPDAIDKSTGKTQGATLFGCALLNDPFIDQQQPVAAADEPNPTAAKAAQEHKMDSKKLMGLLSMTGEATDTVIETILESRLKRLDAAEKELTDIAAKQAEAITLAQSASTKLANDLKASADQVLALTEQVKALESGKKAAAIASYLTECVKAGKVGPAMVDGLTALALSNGIDALKAIYDKAPVIIQMAAVGIEGTKSDLTPEKAFAEFTALMDKHQSAGKNASEAWRMASRERPDLASVSAQLSKIQPA